MVANYLSAVYDLTPFGVYKISNAILCSDIDDNITIEVSFNGGKSFTRATPNVKFPVAKSTGKVQVRITFQEPEKSDIYKVKTNGYFQNLEIGTTVNFTKSSNGNTYKAIIGRNGYYSISLPRGLYDVWYTNASGNRENLLTAFNPEVSYVPFARMDKEAVIEGTFRDLPWAKSCVFDTFEDQSKMIRGTAIVDSDGDLSDGVTSRKCRYWAIGFD